VKLAYVGVAVFSSITTRWGARILSADATCFSSGQPPRYQRSAEFGRTLGADGCSLTNDSCTRRSVRLEGHLELPDGGSWTTSPGGPVLGHLSHEEARGPANREESFTCFWLSPLRGLDEVPGVDGDDVGWSLSFR